MFVENLKKSYVTQIVNLVRRLESGNTIEVMEEDIKIKECKNKMDNMTYWFVECPDSSKYWMSDFVCADKKGDYSQMFRKIMVKIFGQKYIDEFKKYLQEQSNKNIDKEIRLLENKI